MHGRSHSKSSSSRSRSNRVCFQRVSHLRKRRTRWSHRVYRYCYPKRRNGAHPTATHLSLSDIMVRSLFTRGNRRRKPSLRQLEEGNSYSLAAHFAKLALRVQCKHESGASITSGFVCGNQSTSPPRQRNDSCGRDSRDTSNDLLHRQSSGGKCRHRIFQKVEWNLLGKYLSPTDWWNMRLTCSDLIPEQWTWSEVWRGPPVCNPYVASRFVHALTLYPAKVIIPNIIHASIIELAFSVLVSMNGVKNAIEIATHCQIKNLRVWKMFWQS